MLSAILALYSLKMWVYTIQCSSRPDDRILFDCFYYSFSRNYASALLKKEGYDGLEIGKW